MTGLDFSSGADVMRQLEQRLGALADDVPDAAVAALRESVPDVEAAGRKGALEGLPRRGGLAEQVHDHLQLQSTVRGGRRAELKVRVVPSALGLRDPSAANRGRLRHRTYGHRPTVIQLITPGWWSNAMAKVRPQVADRLREAIANSIRKA